MMPILRKNKAGVVASLVLISLAGCGDYLSNRDLISPLTGNATASNTAIQAINPWPPKSYDTDIDFGQ